MKLAMRWAGMQLDRLSQGIKSSMQKVCWRSIEYSWTMAERARESDEVQLGTNQSQIQKTTNFLTSYLWFLMILCLTVLCVTRIDISHSCSWSAIRSRVIDFASRILPINISANEEMCTSLARKSLRFRWHLTASSRCCNCIHIISFFLQLDPTWSDSGV